MVDIESNNKADKTRDHLITRHPRVVIKKVINSTVAKTSARGTTTISPGYMLEGKHKKKVQRVIQKHRTLKHKPSSAGNSTTQIANSVPAVSVITSNTTTVLPVNGTKIKHKYKLVKIIKHKRKKPGSNITSTHAPDPANVSTTITKLNSTSSRIVVRIRKTTKKPVLLNSEHSPAKTNQETPLDKALSLAVEAASEAISKDGSPSSKTLSVSRDVRFGNHTNLTSGSRVNISGSKINKELVECLTKERIAKSGLNLDSQMEFESQRFDMMLQRQQNAARQIRLANRVSESIMRENYDNEVTDRLAESELKRRGVFKRQSKFREQLQERLGQFRMRFSDLRK